MECSNLFKNFKESDIYKGITFDIYNVLFIIIATLISSLGLLYNSTPSILGSMLVSSIVNPLVSSIILIISNNYLVSVYKVFNFVILVIICIVISFSIGLLNQYYMVFNTPTDEMLARITYTHVIVDILLALISGSGIALAILNNDMVSRVGFSLILSITPPLANFGLFYGESVYYYIQSLNSSSEREKIILNEQIQKLSEDGNKSFILFMLNVIAMYTTLLLTLTFMCKI